MKVSLDVKKFIGNIINFLIFILLGLVIVIQFRNVHDEYHFISLKNIVDLQEYTKRQHEENNNLKNLIKTKQDRLKEYERALREEGSIKEVLENEIKSMKIFSGMTDLEGPGIIVKLSDAERELFEWEDPNYLIVHDSDIFRILNDLKAAGAEALSINGQRIMSNSEISCAGPTITINGYTYGQPFVIRAIGDQKTLDAAIKAPDSNATLLREWGLIIESQINDRIRIDRYQGSIFFRYITPKEGE